MIFVFTDQPSEAVAERCRDVLGSEIKVGSFDVTNQNVVQILTGLGGTPVERNGMTAAVLYSLVQDDAPAGHTYCSASHVAVFNVPEELLTHLMPDGVPDGVATTGCFLPPVVLVKGEESVSGLTALLARMHGQDDDSSHPLSGLFMLVKSMVPTEDKADE